MIFSLHVDLATESKIKKWIKYDQVKSQLVRKVLWQLVSDPSYPSLRSHQVISKKTGEKARTCWIDGEYRFIWNYGEGNTLEVFDFGTHKEVYQ